MCINVRGKVFIKFRVFDCCGYLIGRIMFKGGGVDFVE